MNAVERVLDKELLGLLDRVAASIPEGGLAAGATGTLKSRLDEADARAADIRAAIVTEYGRWRRALDDLENLWSLPSWRAAAAQEPVDESAAPGARGAGL